MHTLKSQNGNENPHTPSSTIFQYTDVLIAVVLLKRFEDGQADPHHRTLHTKPLIQTNENHRS